MINDKRNTNEITIPYGHTIIGFLLLCITGVIFYEVNVHYRTTHVSNQSVIGERRYPLSAHVMTISEAKKLFISAVKGDASSEDRLSRSAVNGDVTAQFYLGLCYRLQKDYVGSNIWLLQAAKQGDAPAEYFLGSAYLYGRGVTQNYVTADAWFFKAAEQGYTAAECNLGINYYHGYGAPKNSKLAIYWLKKAADQGDATAEHDLRIIVIRRDLPIADQALSTLESDLYSHDNN